MCCKGTLLVALSACAIALTQAQSLTTLEARDGVPRTNAEAVKRGLPILKPKTRTRPLSKRQASPVPQPPELRYSRIITFEDLPTPAAGWIAIEPDRYEELAINNFVYLDGDRFGRPVDGVVGAFLFTGLEGSDTPTIAGDRILLEGITCGVDSDEDDFIDLYGKTSDMSVDDPNVYVWRYTLSCGGLSSSLTRNGLVNSDPGRIPVDYVSFEDRQGAYDIMTIDNIEISTRRTLPA